jgi:flagellar biosynthetic protein FliQ
LPAEPGGESATIPPLTAAEAVDMTGAEALDIASQGIWTLIIVSLPMMIVGLLVGVVIALFQALTQIQEMTLVFVPKIIAIFITMLLVLPFMGATLSAYMMRVVDMIIVGG